MAQAIKYQNTAVAAEKSAAALSALVRKYGGSCFELQWDSEGNPTAVRFALRTTWGDEVPVRLAPATEVIVTRLRAAGHFSAERARQQAHRIAWRIIHDTSEQLLLQVSLGMTDVGAAFMEGVEVEDPETGEVTTMRDLMARHAHQLAAGKPLRLLPAAVHVA